MGERSNQAFVESVKPVAARPNPNIILAILKDRRNGVASEAFGGDLLEAAILANGEPAIGPDPEISFLVFKDRPDDVAREAVVCRVRMVFAVLELNDSFPSRSK